MFDVFESFVAAESGLRGCDAEHKAAASEPAIANPYVSFPDDVNALSNGRTAHFSRKR